MKSSLYLLAKCASEKDKKRKMKWHLDEIQSDEYTVVPGSL